MAAEEILSNTGFQLSSWRVPQLAAPLPCNHGLPGCQIDSLRASLAREELLLRQKDALILEQQILRKESDHRLLNGLQIVVSLLSLQSKTAVLPETALQLRIAANRVASIERIHRRLHNNDGTQTVAFKQYLEDFCREFSGILMPEDGDEPMIQVEGIEIVLPTAIAIPLGFIVNELITNAAKYGKGKIRVALKTEADGRHTLSVSNAGPAFPRDFDPASAKGLGMKIVQSFTQKIDGKLVIGSSDGGEGARFAVSFRQDNLTGKCDV
jgi:two-component sensor histidine kinase